MFKSDGLFGKSEDAARKYQPVAAKPLTGFV